MREMGKENGASMAEIRRLGLEDFDRLRDCVAGLQDYERQFDADKRVGVAMASDYVIELRAAVRQNDGCAVAAEIDGQVVGFIAGWINPADTMQSTPHFYVSDLYVQDDFRGQGIAARLVEAVEQYAAAKGIPSIVLHVLAQNALAKTFYEKQGFELYELTLLKQISW